MSRKPESSEQASATAGAHAHPNYIAIWSILLFAMLVSVLLGELEIPGFTTTLIFTIAIVKAYLVAAHFMHIKSEPRFVVLILASAAACLYFLFIGLAPDTVFGPFVE